MINMARTKAERKKEADRWKTDTPENTPDYPYGLSISLEEVDVTKLGLEDCEADDVLELVSEATVTTATSHTINGKKRRSLTIQLRKLSVAKPEKKLDLSATLYPKE